MEEVVVVVHLDQGPIGGQGGEEPSLVGVHGPRVGAAAGHDEQLLEEAAPVETHGVSAPSHKENGRRPVSCPHPVELTDDFVQGFIPRNAFKLALSALSCPLHGIFHAEGIVDALPVRPAP